MTAARLFYFSFSIKDKRSSENESAPQNTEFVGRILVSDKHLRFSNLVGYKYDLLLNEQKGRLKPLNPFSDDLQTF
ncbi:hypothetical protein CG828_00020 [Neisseria meningitidis]|nr:hypothetical protein CG828_00020 [Neisseria meningitidis]